MSEVKYKIYPSALDAFQSYLDCEANYERFYGHSENPSLTYAEYEKKCFQELVDKINRVPFDSEAADRGSCFNEIVDCIVLGEKSTRDDIKVSSRSSMEVTRAGGLIDPSTGKVIGGDVDAYEVELPHIEAVMKDRVFRFDIGFCKDAARYFNGALPQVYTEAPIETRFGTVLLYGYIDYLRGDVVYDAKTTSKYEFGKYSKYWQQHVYPWTLIESGKCTDISAFEFTAFQLKGGTAKQPLITGDMYPEVYVYDHKRSEQLLRGICEQFVNFLECNRSLITDAKIFGGEKK